MFPITQPAIFSVSWWSMIIVISYGVARYTRRWWCILVGYLVIAAIIRTVDVAWIRYEMSRPDWRGTPDMDIVFAIGLFTRIGFMSIAMLPVTFIGVWLRKRRTVARRNPPAILPPRRTTDETGVT